MEILAQLGVNQTLWIQLAFFIVAYLMLSNFLFKPYRRNLEYRKKNTSGTVEEATKLTASTEGLAMDYQGRMKRHNESAADIYNVLKSEGHAEEEKLLLQARERANLLIEQARKKISTDMVTAREGLRAQVPQLSSTIASQVLGRDIK
ncbi:MAG: ATP synthase F0 subunit B [Oligoflexia bacterium]|nr:ATP synthase F0 subunit B [Oligoflexia bacterium]